MITSKNLSVLSIMLHSWCIFKGPFVVSLDVRQPFACHFSDTSRDTNISHRFQSKPDAPQISI